ATSTPPPPPLRRTTRDQRWQPTGGRRRLLGDSSKVNGDLERGRTGYQVRPRGGDRLAPGRDRHQVQPVCPGGGHDPRGGGRGDPAGHSATLRLVARWPTTTAVFAAGGAACVVI